MNIIGLPATFVVGGALIAMLFLFMLWVLGDLDSRP